MPLFYGGDNGRNDCVDSMVNDVESFSTTKRTAQQESLMRRYYMPEKGKCRYRHVWRYPHEINNDSHMMMRRFLV
jgi:hypothetical protein